MTRRRPPLQTQAEIDHAYWRERVVLAVAALEAVEDDLIESLRRFQVAQERLAASRESAPVVPWPTPIQPAWSRADEAS